MQRLLFAAVLWLALALPPAAAQPDPFAALNDAARAAYRDARASVLAQAGPTIFVAFDSLVLIDGATRIEERFTPPAYHRLKALGHLVLALQLLLDPRLGAAPPDDVLRTRLAALAGGARALLPALDGALAPAQAARARATLEAAAGFAERALAAGRPDAAALDAWLAALVPAILADVDDAAAAQLDALHALVGRWRALMGEARWARLNVLVPVPRQARRDNVQYAYFVRLLGADAAERRVIFTEGVYGAEDALTLLGTILVDRAAGAAFFGDPARMERDLLGDAARRHLDRLFAR